jgi:hypothetical protein
MGLQSLSYQDKARVLSLLVAGSNSQDWYHNAMLNELLKIYPLHPRQRPFGKSSPSGRRECQKEMACLCVEMFAALRTLVKWYVFLNSSRHTYRSSLGPVTYYVDHLRDSADFFFAVHGRLYGSSNNKVLPCSEFGCYFAPRRATQPANHCASNTTMTAVRWVEAATEEGMPTVLCSAIRFILIWGTKRLYRRCSSEEGVESTQVRLFFGLQQILPLMTQGLLQFPILCSQFFESLAL